MKKVSREEFDNWLINKIGQDKYDKVKGTEIVESAWLGAQFGFDYAEIQHKEELAKMSDTLAYIKGAFLLTINDVENHPRTTKFQYGEQSTCKRAVKKLEALITKLKEFGSA